MNESSTITVTIFGTEYRISANEDSSYIEEVARYVDGKMREVSESASTQSPMKIAVLTALNLADELKKLKTGQTMGNDNTEKKIELMLSSLNSVLENCTPNDLKGKITLES
jgi:cell division protein ZapA